MPAYHVQLLSLSGQTLREGIDVMAVFAADATDAIAVCKSQYSGISDAAWDAATVTAIAAAADMEGFRLQVIVRTPAGAAFLDETYTAIAADTVNDMGDGVAALLLAAANAQTTSYATPLLTIATVGDAVGDHVVEVKMFRPDADVEEDVTIPGFIGAIVDEGVAAAVLTVALVPANVIPAVVGVATGK